jgi:serine/threonine protein kinase
MSSESPAALDSTSKPVSFEFVKELSPGGIASTWLARLSTDRSDAPSVRLAEVLLLNSHVTEKPEVKSGLLHDVAQARRLRHPNVIAIEAATSEGKEIYVATEIVEGESLAALIAAAGTEGLGTDVVLRIGLDTLAALSAAHALRPEPLVHGELTPQQIVVGIEGVTRVGGFGVARTLTKVDPAAAKSQARVGYAAPERVKAMTTAASPQNAQADPRSDLFSAAVILWEGIAKQRLFSAKMDAAVIQKVLTAPIAPLASLPKVQVPPAVDAALLKALERDPARRYQTAEELIAALQKAGGSAIATHEKVATVVEKLANKSITDRRAQLASALTAPAATRPGGSDAKAPAAPEAPAAKPAAPGAPVAPKAGAPVAAAPKATPAPSPLQAKRPAASTLLGMPPLGPEPPKVAPLPAPPAPLAPKPAEVPKRERLETFTGEIFDEATIDEDWSKDDEAAPAAPAAAAKAPTPAAGKPAAATAPKPAAAPAAPKPATAAAPKPTASAAPKPAATATPATATPAAATAGADKNAAAAKGKFQVAPPPPSTRPAVKTPVPPAPSAEPQPEEKAAAPAPAAPAKAPTPAAPRAPIAPKPAATATAAPKPAATAAAAPKPAATAAARPVGTTTSPAAAPVAAAPAPAAKKEAFKADLVEPQKSNQPTPIPETETSEPTMDEASRAVRAEAYDKMGPGTTLGRYEILTPVAKGGMASVWAARIQGTRGFKKIVAIKTMLPDVSDDPEFESMFLDEARIAARIRHPNVVEIHDLGEQDEVLYIVMEWVDGETLTTLMKSAKTQGGLPLPIMLRVASQICAGLHAAHELRGDDGALLDLVHRDVSPGNVLVSSTGFVKVADFGIAKSKGRVHVTQGVGVLKGKAPYLSPEQLRGLPLDRRSDLFSLGTLLYVMASGLHPFRAESEAKTMENIALLRPVPLRDIAPTIHPEFEKIIFKALEKDRNSRFATAAEMQKAIDHLASSIGQPTTDEDVGAFVQKTMGEVIKERAKTLRAAITAVDGPLSSSRPSSPNIDPKLVPTISGAPGPTTDAPPAQAEAKGEAAAGAAPIFEDITIDEDFTDIERPADAKPPVSTPAPARPTPEVHGPKVVVSPAALGAAQNEALADTVAAPEGGAATAVPATVGLLDWPSTPQKLPASTPRPPVLGPEDDFGKLDARPDKPKSDVAVGAPMLGVTAGNGSSEMPFVKDDDLEAFAPKRRKLVPVALGGLLVVGLVVGGIALSGGDKGPASDTPGVGTEQTVQAAPTQAPEAPKPAETAAAAPTPTEPTPEPTPAAPTTTETAAAAAEPPKEPDPPVAPPPTPSPVVKAAPAPVRPGPAPKPPPIKTPPKPGGGKTPPPKKYNPSGI